MSKKIKVFEAFAGVGSQHMALNNININFEIVGTSEIDIDAIISYASIHYPNYNEIERKSTDEMKSHLKSLNIGYDFKKNISSLDKIKEDKLIQLYRASIAMKNFGDISLCSGDSIPDHDLLTYSFPCQDISSVGTQLSCAEGSNTRSSLLWKCKSIIESKRPKYLLLENVKNLIGKTHIKHLNLWLELLQSLGYSSRVYLLDSKDFNIPQRRPRVFVVSVLDENFTFSDILSKPLTKSIIDFIDDSIDFEVYDPEKFGFNKSDLKIDENELKFLDDRDWKFNGIMISDLCSTQRAGRSGLKCIKKVNGEIYARRLSPLECWRLMGFSDTDFFNAKKSNIPDTQILKQCGNSIVVPVLEEIFKMLFK